MKKRILSTVPIKSFPKVCKILESAAEVKYLEYPKYEEVEKIIGDFDGILPRNSIALFGDSHASCFSISYSTSTLPEPDSQNFNISFSGQQHHSVLSKRKRRAPNQRPALKNQD